MRLLYLTNVQIPAKDAQNLQIQAMSKAFWLSLKNDFLLISPQNRGNKDLDKEYGWVRIKISATLPRFLRQGIFILKAFLKVMKFGPDFIFTRDIAVAFVYKILGFQTVYETHKPFETKIGDSLFRIISKRIKIVAISQALKDFIIKKYNLDPGSILVAHDGVFLEDFEKITESKDILRKKYLGINDSRFVALYGGSLQKGKGLELILQAAKELQDIVFVVVGSLPDNFVNLEIPNLIFLGHKKHEEIPYFLRSADLLLLPFTKELKTYEYHSALKLFEYMASGVPILASKLGSTREILNDDKSFLFNYWNINDFTAKILYVKDNAKDASVRASRSLQSVKDYDWSQRAQKIINFVSLWVK